MIHSHFPGEWATPAHPVGPRTYTPGMRPNYANAPTMAAALHWLVNSDTPEEAVTPPRRPAGTRCPPAIDTDALPDKLREAFLHAMAEAAMAPEVTTRRPQGGAQGVTPVEPA